MGAGSSRATIANCPAGGGGAEAVAGPVSAGTEEAGGASRTCRGRRCTTRRGAVVRPASAWRDRERGDARRGLLMLLLPRAGAATARCPRRPTRAPPRDLGAASLGARVPRRRHGPGRPAASAEEAEEEARAWIRLRRADSRPGRKLMCRSHSIRHQGREEAAACLTSAAGAPVGAALVACSACLACAAGTGLIWFGCFVARW
ncbi:unnamed protein product [Urochloa humidicola]